MTIPVTVLGGFLGAGKTTAINRLLADATERIGVLVNDFGAIAVDAALIAARDGDMISLANGCVCCALGPDLGDSLARITAGTPPERIVIEASGVSDPWRIAQLVRLQRGVTLDAVIVLVDSEAFPAQLADRWLADTLARQIARADLIALTKGDLAGEAGQRATRDAIARLRPDATAFAAAAGALAGLLGMAPATPPSRFVADAPDHPFRAWHWSDPPVLDAARLHAVLAALPRSVLRAKGFLRIGPDAAPHVLQRAGRRTALEPWSGDMPPTGLVLIGTADMPTIAELAARFALTAFAG